MDGGAFSPTTTDLQTAFIEAPATPFDAVQPSPEGRSLMHGTQRHPERREASRVRGRSTCRYWPALLVGEQRRDVLPCDLQHAFDEVAPSSGSC